MDNNNVEQLKKLAKIFNTDKVITTDEVQEVLKGVLTIMASFKKENQALTEETKGIVNGLLNRTLDEHEKIVSQITSEHKELKSKVKKDIDKTIKEVKKIAGEIMAMKPKDGEPGKDADEEKIVEDVLSKIKLPEYKETIIEGEDIVDKINELPVTPENQIDAKHIKNLPQGRKGGLIGGLSYLAGDNISIDGNVISSTATGGASSFLDLTDTPSTYEASKGVRVNAGADALEFYDVTDTDEKVKYDAGDTTAGYVADKIIAGTGISVAEGTGGNENKLVITNTDKGSDVDLSGYALTGDIPVDISELTDTTGIIPTSTSDLSNDSGFITAGDIPSIPVNSDFNLGGLGDVNDTGKATGKVLKYNSVSGDWEVGDDNNTTYTATDFDIKDLTDSTNLRTTWSGKQDALTFGIANTNAVKIDHASVADNDYAKFTANGLEGRSYTEVKQDLDLEIGTDIPALTHASQHAVGGADSVFPADPNADRYLMWDDSESALAWAEVSGGSGDFKADGSVPMTGTLTLATGSTTVAPIKMVAGTNLTTPVAGVFEYDGTNLFFTIA